jgi:hypothetical protein
MDDMNIISCELKKLLSRRRFSGPRLERSLVPQSSLQHSGKVSMGANKSGDYNLPCTVKAVIAISFMTAAIREDLLDLIAFDKKIGVLQNFPFRIHGDDRGVLQ